MRRRRCVKCGQVLEMVATYSCVGPDGKSVVLPAGVEVPTCRGCGEVWVDLETAKRLDAALGFECNRS